MLILLSAMIALGSAWLNHWLLNYWAIERVISISLWIIGIILLVLLLEPWLGLATVLFTMIGLAIAVVATSYIIQVSDVSSTSIQGEVMGTLSGLQMLLDGWFIKKRIH